MGGTPCGGPLASDQQLFEVGQCRAVLLGKPAQQAHEQLDPSAQLTQTLRLIQTGEINAIYRKWFESPIPPQQINLKLPMSYLLRDSFKSPTDWVPK